ncbi:uncharacterized protein LOC133316126 [Gastrolobium bilobum]|uniref:uncharacterized protein LOC133316126 n=1 Tax=Gastrolobium bilobum TaxID=150636 RepID=UPI002AB29A1A|nr:uncharacterized protein LOC133316126 [Gastrolobium bilobum]
MAIRTVPAELSLDLRPTFVPKTITDFFYYPPKPSMMALAAIKEEKEDTVMNRLSLLTPGLKNLRESITSFNRVVPSSPLLSTQACVQDLQQQQTDRKKKKK